MKRALFAVVGLAACQAPATIPLPEGTRTIVATILTDEGTRVEVIEVDVESAAMPLEERGSVTLHAFACTPSRLGLSPGVQALESNVATEDLLPDPMAIVFGQTGYSVAPTFETVSNVPAEVATTLRRLRLPSGNRCRSSRAQLQREELVLTSSTGHPTFSVLIDPEHVMIGSRGNHPFIVDNHGVVVRSLIGRDLLGAYVAPSGELWALDKHNRLLRGPPRGPLSVVTSTAPLSSGRGSRALAGPRGDAPFELYAASATDGGDERKLARFDGQAWSLLAQSDRADGLFEAGVAWIGPGEAVAIGMDPLIANAVVRVKGAETFTEILSAQEEDSASITFIPGVGPVIGRNNGQIDLYQNNGWVPVAGTTLTHYLRAVAPLADGFLYATSTALNWFDSGFGQYFPGVGLCPLEVLTSEAVPYLTRFGDGTFLATTIDAQYGSFKLVLLHPLSKARDCGAPP